MPRDTLPLYEPMEEFPKQAASGPAQPKSTYFQPPSGYGQQAGIGYDQPTAPPPYTQPAGQPAAPPVYVQPQFQMPPNNQSQNVCIVNNTQAINPRPANHMTMSILTCVFCNFVLGIPAIIFSALSSQEADEGKMDSARSYGKVAFWLNLAGILFSTVGIVILGGYMTAVRNAVEDSL